MESIKNYENWRLQDFQNYYNENFKGKSRAEISKISSGFYSALYRRELVDKVLPGDKRGKKIKSYKNWKLKDFWDCYNKNFKGKKGISYSKKYHSFYQAIKIRGYNDKMLKYKRWKNFTLKDLQNYYKTNCNGLLRSEVWEKEPSFYMMVCKRKLRDKVFPAKFPRALRKELTNKIFEK